MPTVIQQGGNAATQSGPDGVSILIQQPQAVGLPSLPTTGVACVGTAGDGIPGVVYNIGSGSDVINQVGVPQVSAYDGPTDLDILVRSGNNTIKFVRFTDGTDTAAIFKLLDNTGFASGPITVGGAFAAGVPLTVTIINGAVTVTVNYTTQASDVNLAGVAASLAAAINQSGAVIGPAPFMQLATVNAAVLTLTANTQGTGGNSITIQGSGAGVTLTPTAATPLTGGAAAGVIATLTGRCTGSFANKAALRSDAGSLYTANSPTFKTTVAYPNGTSEIFDNVAGYAVLGGGYSATAYIANVVAAINGAPALSALRPASQRFTAAAGSSTAPPLLGTVFTVATPGTDGSAFAGGTAQATTRAIGSDTAVPKTGMYALSTFATGCQVWLCGNTDLANAGAAEVAFAARENAHAILFCPTGTGSQTAIALKQTLGLASASCSVFKDFAQYADTTNNIAPRQVSGAPFAAATFANTPIQISPANQQVQVLSGTERIGATQVQQYNSTEIDLLESAGINLIASPSNGGPYFSIQHNKNSLGKNDPRGNIAYSRMTMYLAQVLSSGYVLGQLIGQVQSTQPGDPMRRNAKSIIDNTLLSLANGGVIQTSLVRCDLTNNLVANIQRGVLQIDILVQYMSVIDRVVVVFTGGQTVQVSVQPTNLTSLPVAA